MPTGRTCPKCRALNGHSYKHCAGCGELLPGSYPSHLDSLFIVLVVVGFVVGGLFVIQKVVAIRNRAAENDAYQARAKAEREFFQGQQSQLKDPEIRTNKGPDIDPTVQADREARRIQNEQDKLKSQQEESVRQQKIRDRETRIANGVHDPAHGHWEEHSTGAGGFQTSMSRTWVEDEV